MNAGGHGSDMSRSLVSVAIFDLASASVSERSAESLGLRFRGSDLTDSDVVLRAELQLVAGDTTRAMAQIEDIVRWRRENQPGGQNAGSVFVNPVPEHLSAGQLIDECGLRGYRIGTAQVSPKHANFIQADPDGLAADVAEVMIAVQRRVEEQTGHRLRSEIRLVGFPPETSGALS